MRISYTCPAHLKFGLTVEEWSKLVTLTGESIDWLEANERIYDVWLLVAYAATSCALVQVCVKDFQAEIYYSYPSVSYMGTEKGRRCCGQVAQTSRLCSALGRLNIA